MIRFKNFLANKNICKNKTAAEKGELTPRLLDCLRGEYFRWEQSDWVDWRGNNSELSSGISAELRLRLSGETSPSSSSPNWSELFTKEFQDLDVSFWQLTD